MENFQGTVMQNFVLANLWRALNIAFVIIMFVFMVRYFAIPERALHYQRMFDWFTAWY